MNKLVRYPAVFWTSVVAGAFSLIVCLLLIVDFVGRGRYELFDSLQYLELKEQLDDHPQDAALQEAVRELDLQLRTSYFRRRQFMRSGVVLLLGGVVITLITARWAASLRPAMPHPRPLAPDVDPDLRQQAWGRWAAAGVAGVVVIVVSGFAIRGNRLLPAKEAQLAAARRAATRTVPVSRPKASDDNPPGKDRRPQPDGAGRQRPVAAPAKLPDVPTYLAQWPRFRGPTGSGISPFADMPDQWDATSGDGILWKVPVPLPGVNSPIVWKDRVFVSGATLEQLSVFCFAADTGEIRWQRDVTPSKVDEDEFEVDEATGYAASTLATDGVRVYGIFATGDLVALDLAGNVQWQKAFGIPKNPYGHASSLATFRDRLIVQWDQGTPKDDLSKLMALDGATGEVVWEVVRKVPSSWSTPLVVLDDKRPMIVTSAAPWVIAYAAEDGREIWRADCLDADVGPSPVYADGLVFAANESGGMFAIRADGSGDVTDTHVKWTTDIDVPDISSPLVTDKYVLTVSHAFLACFDRQGGEEPLWEEDLVEEVSSSPSAVGNRVYLFSEEGKAWIVEPQKDKCRRIAELEMGEPCRTSPAFQPGRIYIRGQEHLFCIGKKDIDATGSGG